MMKTGPRYLSAFSFAASAADVLEEGYSPPTLSHQTPSVLARESPVTQENEPNSLKSQSSARVLPQFDLGTHSHSTSDREEPYKAHEVGIGRSRGRTEDHTEDNERCRHDDSPLATLEITEESNEDLTCTESSMSDGIEMQEVGTKYSPKMVPTVSELDSWVEMAGV
jgi:hypothetical protein